MGHQTHLAFTALRQWAGGQVGVGGWVGWVKVVGGRVWCVGKVGGHFERKFVSRLHHTPRQQQRSAAADSGSVRLTVGAVPEPPVPHVALAEQTPRHDVGAVRVAAGGQLAPAPPHPAAPRRRRVRAPDRCGDTKRRRHDVMRAILTSQCDVSLVTWQHPVRKKLVALCANCHTTAAEIDLRSGEDKTCDVTEAKLLTSPWQRLAGGEVAPLHPLFGDGVKWAKSVFWAHSASWHT